MGKLRIIVNNYSLMSTLGFHQFRCVFKKNRGYYSSVLLYKENHAIVAWFSKALAMNKILLMCYNKKDLSVKKAHKEDLSMNKETIDTHSLAHTKWNCKYHIVFAPKYRRKVFFEEKRLEIREILRQLCQWKGVEIIEGEVCPDHIHMLVSIPPKMSISGFMGYLKGKSAMLIFQKWGNMKFAYRNREFWCKGYYVDTVGKNTKAIKTYISEQLKRDKESDQLSLFDPRDPFMGK